MRFRAGKRRIWLRIVAVLFAAGVAAECALMLAVYLAGARSWPEGRADVAIVLGARVMPDGEMSTTLLHRAEKALEMYRRGDVKRIIVCGGQGPDEPMAEADAMADALIQGGVDPAHVFRDAASIDTIENLRNAMAIMAEQGLESAAVVTSEYHLTRALWIARDQGLSALGAPAAGPDTLPKQLEANVRETLSWINYWSGGLIARITRL